jgi:microcystin-dependent protein
LVAISQNPALFSLLGTQYGGDGKSTYALPNLQGSVALGQGQGTGLGNYVMGQQGGQDSVALVQSEMPIHTHTANSSARTSGESPVNSAFSDSDGGNVYSTSNSTLIPMNFNLVSMVGGNLPHNNMMPFLALNWIIALQGVFPSRP